MSFIILFLTVIAFSLLLTAVDKISSFKKDDKSVWMDGDSIRVKRHDKDNPKHDEQFMTRIS